MEKTNYISVAIKILDIMPLIENLITNSEKEEEELLIIFQGNNTFFDLSKLLYSKEEILVNINKNKKTIIISLIKSDKLLSSTIFYIKNGIYWIAFNNENQKNELISINQIKIKIFCKINNLQEKKENLLIKNNSINNLFLKERILNEKSINKLNDYSPNDFEKINYYINNSYRLKPSFTLNNNIYHNKYHSIITENSNKNNASNSPSSIKEPKVINKLNKNNAVKKQYYFPFNDNKKLNKKKDTLVKSQNTKIIKNKIKNNMKIKNKNVNNDEKTLITFDGNVGNNKTKNINENKNNSNGKASIDIKKNNKGNKKYLFYNYFSHLYNQNKEKNIKVPINNIQKASNSPFTSKTHKTDRNNKNINKDYDNKNSNKIKDENLEYRKENYNGINNNSDYSSESLNEDSYDCCYFYKLKEDFLLLYNDDYNNNVKEDLLKLEIDLFVEKMIELINSFHINIKEKIIENQIIENKYKSKIEKYILIKKLYLKLQQLKYNQKEKTNNYLRANNSIKDYNILNKNEIDLFKFIFPNLNDFNNNIKINKKNMLREIINIILNNNENKKLINEENIKLLEKYNIIKENKEIYNINNNKEKQIEDNDSLSQIKNNSINEDLIVYKRKKLNSYGLKNKINNFQN